MSVRSRLIIIFLTCWFAIIIVRMAYLASGFSSRFRIESEAVSGKLYKIQAHRGAIYDAKNRKLVWSEKFYRLTVSGTLDENETEQLKNLLSERELPQTIPLDHQIDHLTAKELLDVEKLVKNTPALHLSSVNVRRRIDAPGINKLAGTVSEKDGSGVSGWEKQYDNILRGTDGELRVTRDRMGRWLKGSGEIKKMPVPGRDVKLDMPFEELIK